MHLWLIYQLCFSCPSPWSAHISHTRSGEFRPSSWILSTFTLRSTPASWGTKPMSTGWHPLPEPILSTIFVCLWGIMCYNWVGFQPFPLRCKATNLTLLSVGHSLHPPPLAMSRVLLKSNGCRPGDIILQGYTGTTNKLSLIGPGSAWLHL